MNEPKFRTPRLASVSTKASPPPENDEKSSVANGFTRRYTSAASARRVSGVVTLLAAPK
jgi:hypothetical protein